MDRILLSVLAFPLLVVQLQPAQRPPSELILTGPKVLFFEPTKAERDSIVRLEGLEMAQRFDDFDYYSGRASAYLKANGIPYAITTTPVFVVRLQNGVVRKIDRRSFAEPTGSLLTDGVREPLLLPGTLADEELIAEIGSFFRLR